MPMPAPKRPIPGVTALSTSDPEPTTAADPDPEPRVYSRSELNRRARCCVRGMGRLVRWELQVHADRSALRIHYTTRDGTPKWITHTL